MKLLFCRECQDVVKLRVGRSIEATVCKCGASTGRYLEDGWHAEVQGPCEVIGMANTHLRMALHGVADASGEYGPDIGAWMFPHDYTRIERKGR